MCPRPRAIAIEVLRNGDEIFPAMLDAIDDAHHTIDFLTFVYWKGEIGREFAHALADRARPRRASARAARFVRRPHDRTRARRRCSRAPAWTFAGSGRSDACRLGQTEPPDAPEGDDRRRGDGLHRRCRHRRSSGRATRATSDDWRDTHFRIARARGRRAARRVPRQLGRDRSPVLFDESRRSVPASAGTGVGGRPVRAGRVPRRAGATSTPCSATLLQLAEERIRIATAYFVPDDELVDRLVRRAASRRRGRAARSPARTPTSASCSSRARTSTRRCSTRACASGPIQPSMLHAKVMTVDGVVANIGSANLNSRSTAPRRGDQRRRDRPRPHLGARSAVRRRSRVEPARRSRRVAPALTGRTRGGTGALAVPSRVLTARQASPCARTVRAATARHASPKSTPTNTSVGWWSPRYTRREADRGDHDDREHAGRGAHGRPGSAAADDDREPGEQDGRRRGVTRREARRRRGGVRAARRRAGAEPPRMSRTGTR